MGWRVDQHYDDARKEEYCAWLHSLSWKDRLRWRFAQGIRLCVAFGAAAAIGYVWLRG